MNKDEIFDIITIVLAAWAIFVVGLSIGLLV